MARCEICHRGMAEGVTLYRVNEVGVEGIWRCRDHRPSEDLEPDPELEALVDLIEFGDEESPP